MMVMATATALEEHGREERAGRNRAATGTAMMMVMAMATGTALEEHGREERYCQRAVRPDRACSAGRNRAATGTATRMGTFVVLRKRHTVRDPPAQSNPISQGA